jgi:aminoglycoside phosphotransferase (APT) family kinase protein
MGREHMVLSRLWQGFDLAPRSFLYCDDPGVIGAPFHIMERRKGAVLTKGNVTALKLDPAQLETVSRLTVDVLARFHRVDRTAVGLEGLGKPQGFLARQIRGWTDRWARVRTTGPNLVDELLAWLDATQPEASRTTLIHNDYRLDNLILDAETLSKPIAVLDWDMATTGDPLCDLGTLLAQWPQAGDDPGWIAAAEMPSTCSGFITRRAAVALYRERTGFDVSRVDWYLAFGLVRLAIAMEQIARRDRESGRNEQRLVDFPDRVRAFVRTAEAVRNKAISCEV